VASRTADARARILVALELGNVRSATTGKFAAPCVLVEPGDPWSVPDSLHGRRLTRWKLTAIAGRTDSEAAIETLCELVDATDAALLQVDGVQLPSWAQPFDALLAGVPYAASVATVQLVTAEEGSP